MDKTQSSYHRHIYSILQASLETKKTEKPTKSESNPYLAALRVLEKKGHKKALKEIKNILILSLQRYGRVAEAEKLIERIIKQS